MTTSRPYPIEFRLWTAEERAASMRQALAALREGEDAWVFGYGSLVWRPDFEFTERRLATLHGHHRALCLWSRVNRGTPESPGLVLGLDRGGSCRGVAYRLEAARLPELFTLLWQREMSTGAYLPRWLTCTTDQGPVQALAFIMNRNSPGYIHSLPHEEVLAIVRRAAGKYGPCTEYVVQTELALRAAGIHDRQLARIALAIQAEQHVLPEE